MPDYTNMLYAFETHDFEAVRMYFEEGGNPNEVHAGVPLFTSMVEMYMRSPRFVPIIRLFVENGLEFTDKALLATLADDAATLETLIKSDPAIVDKKYSHFNNTFTPLKEATLVHHCAEFNLVKCAAVLVRHGADVNARAGVDENGFGGHTPIFHTVCQLGHASKDMLYYLLDNDADLSTTVRGFVWGKGYEWETFIPAVNPVSYAMMGLLPQVHRAPRIVAEVVSLLVKRAYGIDYTPPNVPNAYLSH